MAAEYGYSSAASGLSKKQHLLLRKSALWNERSSWITRYRDISDHLLPYAGRFFTQDRNRGDRTFNNIYDETATFALDTLAAGMMAGMTSPARPWFQLAISDRDLMELETVKIWLAKTAQLMRDIFAKSNTYNALHSLYEELGAFATAGTIIEPDFDTVIHHKVLTAGEYAIAANAKGRVDTLVREFDMTIAQIVGEFVYSGERYAKPDWSCVSPTIKNNWDLCKNIDAWVTVNHVIEPRLDRDGEKRDSKNMRFKSCYFEPGRETGDERLLRESGYNNFPALAPRWSIRGGDIYGHGPSFRALGSIKQLQQEQLRKGQAIDYKTKPPLAVPAEMKNKMSSVFPGGVLFIPPNAQNRTISAAFEVNLDLEHLLIDIQDVRGRINRSFYADLFLMISQDNRRTPATATEIAERHEEKLLMLGPVLERLHNELLGPKIDLTFARIVETGILPPPPPELQEKQLKVEFISPLAQAQKMIGLGSLDRLLGTVGNLAAGTQDIAVWDKIDIDEAIDRYADMLGTDPVIVRSDDKVAEIRANRAQAQQAQAKMVAAQTAASTAKDLSAADTSKPNALTDILRQTQGYNATV